jgi:hypothetical protein
LRTSSSKRRNTEKKDATHLLTASFSSFLLLQVLPSDDSFALFLMTRSRKALPAAGDPPVLEALRRDEEGTGSVKTAVKKRSENDAAKSLILLQKEEDLVESNDTCDVGWVDLVESSPLIHLGLRGDVNDATFVAFGQCTPALLTQDDRVGKYKHRPIGFVGFCCTYCQGQPGFGRYFPGSYDSLLNGTNSSGILQHLLTECRRCPARVRSILADLSAASSEAALGKTDLTLPVAKVSHRPKYGSRKRFFTYVWDQLRKIDEGHQQKPAKADATAEVIPTAGDDENPSLSQDSNTINLLMKDVDHGDKIDSQYDQLFEQIVENSEIVHLQDRYLVSDVTLIAMAQMKVCFVTAEDQIGRCKDHALGFKGLCCLHCGGKAGKPGYGRYFPSSLRSLAQADSCQQIIKHVSTKCSACPPDVRQLIVDLSKSENSKSSAAVAESGSQAEGGRIKYGSRKIFFCRVWARLHGEVSPEVAEMEDPAIDCATKDSVTDEAMQPPEGISGSSTEHTDEDIPIPWERVVGDDNVVVNLETDRGLISDAQLAAIAQMSICHLTEADRIGWFKNRTLGFGGLCCKHCGGRPSFGRYFPNSVRSFAQTTSSQTIISHIALYCPKCPKDIRDIIMHLQRKENDISGTVTLNHSNYGSRKVFFDRVWSRIHPPSTESTLSDVVGPIKDSAASATVLTVSADGETEQSRASDASRTKDVNHSTVAELEPSASTTSSRKRLKIEDTTETAQV